MTYVVLKGYLYNTIGCVKPAVAAGESIQKRQFFSIILSIYISLFYLIHIRLVLVSDPGLVSPFFRDELLAPVLHFVSVDRGERGLGGKRIVP